MYVHVGNKIYMGGRHLLKRAGAGTATKAAKEKSENIVTEFKTRRICFPLPICDADSPALVYAVQFGAKNPFAS